MSNSFLDQWRLKVAYHHGDVIRDLPLSEIEKWYDTIKNGKNIIVTHKLFRKDTNA